MKWFKDNIDWQGIITLLFAGLLVAALSGVIALSYKDAKTKTICIQNGYPNILYANGVRYCHKLENGNDVIVPVNQLESKE